MTTIRYESHQFDLQDNETVLECLLRNNIQYSHSCKSGVCQSCVGKITEGEMKPDWQTGLKETLCHQNYFLPCIAKPQAPITFSTSSNNDIDVLASIKTLDYLNDNILSLKLLVDDLSVWIPGQYINLVNPLGEIRSYSIANVPVDDGYIELHIKILETGKMGNWLKNKASKGTKVKLRGPIGDCYYYNPNKETYPLLLAGTSTGLAPLIAILREAIKQDHQGEIIIIHGGYQKKDLYFDTQLTHFANSHNQMEYYQSIFTDDASKPIDKIFLQQAIKYPSSKVYVCGPEDTTKKLKTAAFLSGIPSKNIYSDAFIF
jgi:NAD(P)H-flavin reductase/ferredoxin